MATYPPNQTTPKKGSDGYLWNWLGSPLKKFAAAISPYIGGGAGGKLSISVTYLDLLDLISTGTLDAGSTYKIIGFNRNMPSGGPGNLDGYLPEVLYDDGTNSGVTIYMKALSATQMETSGYGEFYNPIYGDQTTYTNTDGTGLYRIWDGDNPDPLQVPAYGIGDVVFWGGYAWQNISGNVGNDTDIVTLSAIDWVKLPYSNTTWYTKVTDEIKVDWNNGIIVERYNPENQIRVAYNGDQYSWWVGYYTAQVSPISVMAWGLYSKVTPEGLDNEFFGISNLEVINSWMETVSFKGEGLLNVYMNTSGFYNNYIGINAYVDEIKMTQFSTFRISTLTNGTIYHITLDNYSGITLNTLDNSSIYYNVLNNGSYITNSVLTNSAGIHYNTLDNSYMTNNTLTNGIIYNNTLIASSAIAYNTLDNGVINNNIFDNGNISSNTLTNSNIENNTLTKNSSGIYSNTLNSGAINSNTLTNASGIYNNALTNNGNIGGNTLTTNSNIYESTLTNNGSILYNILELSTINNNTLDNSSYIWYNTLTSSSLDGTASGTLTSNSIQNNTIRYAQVTADISAATHIYTTYSKDIFTRQDGTVKLSYYDNSDVLTVVAVTA